MTITNTDESNNCSKNKNGRTTISASEGAHNIRGSISSFVQNIKALVRNQDFAMCPKSIIDYLEKVKNLNSAIIILKFSPVNLGLLTEVDCSGLIIANNKTYKADNIHVIEVASIDLPPYVLEKVKAQGSTVINLDNDDLQKYYEEQDIEIEKSVSMNDIMAGCVTTKCLNVTITDRLFYIRIDYIGDCNAIKGTILADKITDLPDDLAQKIYPFKSTSLELSAD